MIWMKSRVRPPLARRTVRTRSDRPGKEALVPDPKQRPARNVADSGRLDHERAGLATRETLVPGEHLRCDHAVLGGAPRHHGRHPGALRQVEPALVQRAEPA